MQFKSNKAIMSEIRHEGCTDGWICKKNYVQFWMFSILRSVFPNGTAS